MRRATKVVTSDIASDVEGNIMADWGRSSGPPRLDLTEAYRDLIQLLRTRWRQGRNDARRWNRMQDDGVVSSKQLIDRVYLSSFVSRKRGGMVEVVNE
jgi:hypothetical protein